MKKNYRIEKIWYDDNNEIDYSMEREYIYFDNEEDAQKECNRLKNNNDDIFIEYIVTEYDNGYWA